MVASDRERWLSLRQSLWPDHAVEELTREVDSYLSGGDLWNLGVAGIPFLVLVADLPPRGVVGFVEASLRPFADGCRSAPVGYLEGWFVEPEFRRRGIGGALVRAAEDWARTMGCREMASDARSGNTLSEVSHRSLGYTVVRRSVHFRHELG